ncbi:MAG: hypothetical protein JWM09_1521 [Francisellaceae bacterium]|nr:hypothetical protein [Francisellaceae bacterium]
MKNEINYLSQGHQKFKEKYLNGDDDYYKNICENGQHPRYLVIACSDSRVDPAILFNCKPGDLFVIRNIANLVPPFEDDLNFHGVSAALEFGVCVLNIKHVIVLGHSQCSGILSLMTNHRKKNTNFIDKWVEIALPARDKAIQENPDLAVADLANNCARHSLLGSLSNLKTFPWIKEKVDSKSLFLHAWYYELSSGTIMAFNDEQDKFMELK